MVEYLTKTQYALKSISGVTVTMRKMSQKRRVALNSQAAQVMAKVTEMRKEMDPVEEEIKRAEEAAKIEPCTCNHAVDVDPVADCHDTATGRCARPGCQCREPKPDPAIGDYVKMTELHRKFLDLLTDEVYPIYIKWAVSEVQGLRIDGRDATVDDILNELPDHIIFELGAEVQRLINMSPDEALGFRSPTTSDAGPVEAKPTDQPTAPPAKPTSATDSVTAVAISPI